MSHIQLSTPLGLLEITASAQAIQSILFVESSTAPLQSDSEPLTRCQQQLCEYFSGSRQHFDLPLAPAGTVFQQQVWQSLCHVPYGMTASYSQIAKQLQNPKAVRAIGAANGKNPLTIVVPCHRIIGADGSLTGYAAGLERKKWLLQHEQKHV